MGKTSKKTVTEEVKGQVEVEVAEKSAAEEIEPAESEVEESELIEGKTEEFDVPANVERLMKLYPQYEQFYVTPKGFLHPVNAPAALIKDAVLYQNLYYNKQ